MKYPALLIALACSAGFSCGCVGHGPSLPANHTRLVGTPDDRRLIERIRAAVAEGGGPHIVESSVGVPAWINTDRDGDLRDLQLGNIEIDEAFLDGGRWINPTEYGNVLCWILEEDNIDNGWPVVGVYWVEPERPVFFTGTLWPP